MQKVRVHKEMLRKLKDELRFLSKLSNNRILKYHFFAKLHNCMLQDDVILKLLTVLLRKQDLQLKKIKNIA